MKNRTTAIQIIVLLIITFLAGFYFGVNKVKFDWVSYKPQISVVSKEPPTGTVNVDFTQFWTVWEKLQTDYYDKSKLDSQKMLNGAISGMVQSVGDPFTLYLPPVQNDSFKQGLAGQFSGIGAELGAKGKDVVVIAPLSGTPAEKAGIKAGDIIQKVDGVSTAGWSLAQTVEKIRGQKGTPVTLSVVHKDSNKSVEIKIVRDTITVKSVDGWLKKVKDIDSISLTKIKDNDIQAILATDYKNDSIVYIRLSQFGDSTNKDWTALVNSLAPKIKADKNFKGVVLDLRNNPGGYLTDAVFIASEFLPIGSTVVSEESAQDKKSLSVTREGKLVDAPIIVLVNKGSASASEIVAGALRDDKKTILVGETTFGKGTIQQAEDLGSGSGLHITIAKWLTPNGTWVNGAGLKPDDAVALDAKDPSRDTQLEKAIEELLK